MAQLPEHFTPSQGDSAGQPWAGRRFEANPFADDDGSTPAAYADAIAAFWRSEAGPAEVVDALRDCRVLIPLVAELGEAGENAEGVTVDKSADLSIVTVAGPDGRTVLPVFSSADAMRAWNPSARPVPSLFRNAALAAADERTDLMIVDPGSDTEFGLRRPAVWAVAQGEAWRPAPEHPEVAEALADGVAGEAGIVRLEVAAGSVGGSLVGPELQITIVFEPELDADAVRAAVARASERWGASEPIVANVDSLAISVASAGEAGEPGETASRRTGDAGPAHPEPDDASGARTPTSSAPPRRGLRALFSRRRAD